MKGKTCEHEQYGKIKLAEIQVQIKNVLSSLKMYFFIVVGQRVIKTNKDPLDDCHSGV